jgi:hypothetical protein
VCAPYHTGRKVKDCVWQQCSRLNSCRNLDSFAITLEATQKYVGRHGNLGGSRRRCSIRTWEARHYCNLLTQSFQQPNFFGCKQVRLKSYNQSRCAFRRLKAAQQCIKRSEWCYSRLCDQDSALFHQRFASNNSRRQRAEKTAISTVRITESKTRGQELGVPGRMPFVQIGPGVVCEPNRQSRCGKRGIESSDEIGSGAGCVLTIAALGRELCIQQESACFIEGENQCHLTIR